MTPDINIDVTFRHTESTEALKSYAEEKLLNCVQKFITSNADVHIVLLVEKRDHIAEVNISSKDYDLQGKAVTEDLYSAIDKVADNISKQLRRKKDKIISSKHQPASM